MAPKFILERNSLCLEKYLWSVSRCNPQAWVLAIEEASERGGGDSVGVRRATWRMLLRGRRRREQKRKKAGKRRRAVERK